MTSFALEHAQHILTHIHFSYCVRVRVHACSHNYHITTEGSAGLSRSFQLGLPNEGSGLALLRLPHTGPTVGHLKRLGDSDDFVNKFFSVFSAVFEAFGTARTVSCPIQHAKSESVAV